MLKHSGIVRRIDDLGRIVIPKEIRHKLSVKEGDPMEISENGHFIALRKYSTAELGGDEIGKILHSFLKVTSMPVIICSTTHILQSYGITVRELASLNAEFADALKDGKNTCSSYELIEESGIITEAVERIYYYGNVEGAIIIPKTDKIITDEQRICLKLCATAISEMLI